MTVIYEFSDKNINQVHQLDKEAWWAKNRSLEDTINCVKGSQICIGILDENNNLIGFTRVISDFIYKAIIFDVIVSASHQGTGLGKKLITLIKNHEQLQPVKQFELYCLPEMESFYSNLIFQRKLEASN